MADALQLTQVEATPLVMRIQAEFFAAMNRIAFEPLVQADPPKQHNMVNFLHRSLSKLPLRTAWGVTWDPSIEPSHPEWFAQVEARGTSFINTCDVKDEAAEADMKTVFAILTEEDAHLYCETNDTTHLRIGISLDQGRRRRTLEKVRNLAMLVLAFEEVIDKMLADHASAHSNANNILFVDFSPKHKLRHIWSAQTPAQIVGLMCPNDPSFAHEGWGAKTVSRLNELYKYNFRAVTSPQPERAHTVEFRQHQSTLNANEIIYWMKFVGGLVDLADTIADNDLIRLVHMEDAGEVNITELFCAMVNLGTMTMDLDMVNWYTRKIYARGGRTRVRSKMRLGERQAGARAVRWRDLRDEDTVGA